MALMTLPRTPTLEPVKRELTAYLQGNLQQALDLVRTRALAKGYPDVDTPLPLEYRQATIVDPSVIIQWPTLTVTGWFMRSSIPHEQIGSQEWIGSIELMLFQQNTDEEALATSLDRYAAAIWLVCINADEDHELGGSELLYHSQQIEHSEAGGGSMVSRAVRLAFDVKFGT